MERGEVNPVLINALGIVNRPEQQTAVILYVRRKVIERQLLLHVSFIQQLFYIKL